MSFNNKLAQSIHVFHNLCHTFHNKYTIHLPATYLQQSYSIIYGILSIYNEIYYVHTIFQICCNSMQSTTIRLGMVCVEHYR